MREEKVKLELKGLKRSKLSSIEISAQLNDALVKLLSQKVKGKSEKAKLEKLRKLLFMGRRDS
jgi:hypothetical protein